MLHNEIGLKTWKKYQNKNRRKARTKNILKRLPFLGVYGFGIFFILSFIVLTGSWISAHLKNYDSYKVKASKVEAAIEIETPQRLSKTDLKPLLMDLELVPSPISGEYEFTEQDTDLTISTSIDSSLQNYIRKLLRRSRTYQAAVIAMNPRTGEVFTMVNYAKKEDGQAENLCLNADIPAASLFKIVSASAVLEAKNFSPDTPLYYRGGKYTLYYKSQLKENLPKNRYTYKTSLKRAFSGSNNPVFGRLGIYDIGSDLMREYSNKYMFNNQIPFELSLEKSLIEIPDDDFGLAEIASGFNKRTLISPIHASMITSAIVNNGRMMEPRIVTEIQDKSGVVLYAARDKMFATPINKDTSEDMKSLMNDTVLYGTCSKTFRTLRKKKKFQDINLGAKSGTINDPLDKYKYDWLTAFAVPKNGEDGIVITVLAVHGKLLGIRAKDLARDIINYHFS